MPKDINREGMTRGNFEQMFGDVKESFTHEIVKSNDQLSTKIDTVHADQSESIDSLGSRSDGDHAALISDFKDLKVRFDKLAKHVERTTVEKVKL